MKPLKNTVLLIVTVFLYTNIFSQVTLTPVDSFGSNPGNLKMYTYVPAGVSDTVSLVVALHGCTQTATSFATETGWNKLADRHKFLVLYPEQQSANNSAFCFNWFDSLYQIKNQIEVLSVKQMVDYMKSHYTFDTTKIYITGLSAGACMTTIMLANYPETFKKGAIMAGVPFRASKDTSSAFTAMGGSVIKTPGEWSGLVKDVNPGFTGAYPDVAIFHGVTDAIVNTKNATELIKQWTDLNNADQIADNIDTLFQGDTAISQIIYRDSVNNEPVVYYYKIKGMGHGIAVDTGSCPRQGGATAAYALKAHFHSTYWAADFFDLLKEPYSISGAVQVSANAGNIVYSVVNDSGSAYQWTVPLGASIVSGQGTNSITVNFAANSGIVSTQEMTVDSCMNDVASLYVSVLSYNVTVSQTSAIACHGSATGGLSAFVTGGKPPFTYNWSPLGGTASVASGLRAGNYMITVTDSSSAVISSNSFAVIEPAAISSDQTFTVCAGQRVTVGTATHTTSGTFTDILRSYKNCDSTVTTHLTVLSANTTNQTFTKCPGETVTVGSSIHTATGVFTDILTGFNGCDSVVTTNLTILPTNTFTQTITKCAGESIVVGSSNHQTTGTFTDVLTSSKGCDSTVITHLTVLTPIVFTQADTICAGGRIVVGSSIHKTEGTFTDVLTSFQGCDSTVTTHLTVKNVIDVSVNISSGSNVPVLTANKASTNYQWISCNNANAAVVNADQQSFEAAQSGSYALVISENNCSDTSFCYEIIVDGIPIPISIPSGITENNIDSDLNIYPNPFHSYTTIEFSEMQVNSLITITDRMGKEVKEIQFTGTQLILEKGGLSEGLYFIKVIDTHKNVLNRKILIQ